MMKKMKIGDPVLVVAEFYKPVARRGYAAYFTVSLDRVSRISDTCVYLKNDIHEYVLADGQSRHKFAASAAYRVDMGFSGPVYVGPRTYWKHLYVGDEAMEFLDKYAVNPRASYKQVRPCFNASRWAYTKDGHIFGFKSTREMMEWLKERLLKNDWKSGIWEL